MDVRTPVVVLGTGRHGGLGVVRSLGRLGIAVSVLDHDSIMLASSSRYCAHSFIWDIGRADPKQSIALLQKIAGSIGKAILIPATDATAMFVATHSELLQEFYIFPRISLPLVQSLCNKKEMFFLAQRMGIPTPETFFPHSRASVAQYSTEARFPIIIKPIRSFNTRDQLVKKAIVNSPQELLKEYDAMAAPESADLMLQEYISGVEETSWMFNGYFDANSRCIFGATGYKIRQYQPYAGITSLGVCFPNPRLSEITERFMSAIGYQGPLDIGYRYDPRDDQYKVFDVNPRLGCTFRLFVSCEGMDVVRALYLDLTGQGGNAGNPRKGRKWMVEDLDIIASLHYWRSGGLAFREWVSSFRGLEECALFAGDDMRPMFRAISSSFRHLVRRKSLTYEARHLDANRAEV